MATDPNPDPENVAPRGGTACNLVTVSLLIAVPLFSVLGYRYGSSEGWQTGLAGAAGGFLLGVLLAPLLFILLVAFAHAAIKIQDRLR